VDLGIQGTEIIASYAALAIMMMIAVAEDVNIINIRGNAVIMNMKIASFAALLTAAIMASIIIAAVAMIIVVVVVMALEMALALAMAVAVAMALEEAISYS
jgi:hypothetical protein